MCSLKGLRVQHEAWDDGPRGLGEFQQRLNRDRDHRHWGQDVESGDRQNGWGGETPRSDREGRDSAPSVRVLNLGWESTPRRGQGGHRHGENDENLKTTLPRQSSANPMPTSGWPAFIHASHLVDARAGPPHLGSE